MTLPSGVSYMRNASAMLSGSLEASFVSAREREPALTFRSLAMGNLVRFWVPKPET